MLGSCNPSSEVTMKGAVVVCLAMFCVAVSSTPLLAHHSSAAYDTTKVITLKGTVTSVDFRNPHVRIHLDVTDADRRIVNWDIETWGTGQLSVRGLTNGFLKPGDQIKTDVFIAKE